MCLLSIIINLLQSFTFYFLEKFKNTYKKLDSMSHGFFPAQILFFFQTVTKILSTQKPCGRTDWRPGARAVMWKKYCKYLYPSIFLILLDLLK